MQWCYSSKNAIREKIDEVLQLQWVAEVCENSQYPHTSRVTGMQDSRHSAPCPSIKIAVFIINNTRYH